MQEPAKETESEGALAPKNPTALLVVLFAAAFVAAFNENIVNVGLVDIMASFDVPAPTAQWLVTGYMIVTTIVVSIVAWLQKRFSLRTLFFAASALILVGALADLAAPTFALLLVFRLLQAVGTGIFVPVMMTTVLALAPRQKLGSYLAIGSACITLGPALGPVASGIVVTMLGWRAMFVLPVVAMAAILAAGALYVHPIAKPVHEPLDIASVVLSAVGLTLLVYGLLVVTVDIARALGCLATGVACIAVFAWRQRRIPNPVLGLSPLSSPHFALSCLLVVVCMMTTFSLSVLLPLYFEQAGGTSALVAGVLLLPPILVNAATALAGGRILDKRGEAPLLPAGYALMAVGLGLLVLAAPSLRMLVMVLCASVAYAAVGLVMSPTQTSGLGRLPRNQHPSGVSLMNTFIQLAASIGPSLFVGIMSSTAAARMQEGSAFEAASASGFASASSIACAIAAAGLVASLVYVRLSARSQAQAPQEAPVASSPSVLRDIMKTDVYTVAPTDTVATALQLLVDKRVSGVPVVDARGTVVGFVSDGDIMRYLADLTPAFKSAYSFVAEQGNTDFEHTLAQLMELPVSQIATKGVVSVDVDAGLGEVCRVLADSHMKKAPVLEDGRMVGIVNRSNVSRYCIGSYLQHQHG